MGRGLRVLGIGPGPWAQEGATLAQPFRAKRTRSRSVCAAQALREPLRNAAKRSESVAETQRNAAKAQRKRSEAQPKPRASCALPATRSSRAPKSARSSLTSSAAHASLAKGDSEPHWPALEASRCAARRAAHGPSADARASARRQRMIPDASLARRVRSDWSRHSHLAPRARESRPHPSWTTQ